MNRYLRPAVCLFAAVLLLSSCAGRREITPVTVSIWHVYGGQTSSPLNGLIDEFNATAGREKNIRVTVGSVENAAAVSRSVLAAARGDPGTSGLPDMFSAYPNLVRELPENTRTVDFSDYFSPDELSGFVPSFIGEGIVDGCLRVLPVAKSAEVMFVNRTLFDRFAAASGVKLSELNTWEGLFAAAEKYTAWTDGQTPDVPDDGKCFLALDDHIYCFATNAASLGEPFMRDGHICFGSSFLRSWAPFARAGVSGALWLREGYATEPLRTADAVVSIGSSASVLYYSDTVTYPDNTSERVSWQVLPRPLPEGGRKTVGQFGIGMCVLKTTPEKEKACVDFLKWLTESERNVKFAVSMGYMPVKTASYDIFLPRAVDELKDPKYISLYKTYAELQKNYTYISAPPEENPMEKVTRFEKLSRQTLAAGRAAYLGGELSLEDAARKTLADFRAVYGR